MNITPELVERIADLSRLELADGEKRDMTAQLERIIA